MKSIATIQFKDGTEMKLTIVEESFSYEVENEHFFIIRRRDPMERIKTVVNMDNVNFIQIENS